MKYAQIRQAFIKFFADKNHQYVESSNLIPHNDPSLMFTNAGMNQFKDVFIGVDKRDYSRAVSIQKCLRAGGKHNDLENVGFTARHHTFFEMMGNFSFGDYFKEEAIAMAWEFLTQVLKIPKERLYITVFTTDDEAAEIWEKQIGVPSERIFRYGEKDNFWRMGQTGPCGPCSEIFYDHKPDAPAVPIDQDEDRFVEIWNLVFMQFFEDEQGNQTPLPKPSVDTGAGIERIAALMQGFSDNYQCDVFAPLIEKTCELTGLKNDWNELAKKAETLGAIKVLADHSRAACFLISEGVLPSNEGKGYVLRRIMRRAIRYARKLNSKDSLYPQVCSELIETMGTFYPILKEKRRFILDAVQDEEKRFLQTLDKGSELLIKKIQELKAQGLKELDGQTAFTLYGTYGFPFDLTEVIVKEHSLKVDQAGFEQALEQDKNMSRSARKSFDSTSNEKHLGEWTQSLSKDKGPTHFLGYTQLSVESKVVGLSDGKEAVSALTDSGWVAFDSTPFYAEGGGQVSDHGSILNNDQTVAQVSACKKFNDIFIHAVEISQGSINMGDSYSLQVTTQLRQATANNHSATHLLNAALKKVLGSHVNQAGSLVNSQKLRFDFNHNQPLSSKEIKKIEFLVNEQIFLAKPVLAEKMSHKQAINEGAVAMFGEKYGDEVRVVSMGKEKDKVFSKELCGGTHVSNTAEIRLFKVLSETGVAAGARRIEAITGEQALGFLNNLAEENLELRRQLNVTLPKADSLSVSFDLSDRVQSLQQKIKNLEQEVRQKASQSISIDAILDKSEERDLNGEPLRILFTRLETSDRKLLNEVADKLRDKTDKIAMVLLGDNEAGKPYPLIVAVTKSVKQIHAGKITKELCQILGGKGGGRPDFAQGSATHLDKLNLAKEKFYELIGQ